jgi:succinoglycan biosynthesis transport protein ExoP
MLQRTSDPQHDNSFSHDPRIAGDGRPFDSGLDLRSYLQIARRRGPMVAAIAVLFGIVAIIYALQLTPVYTARATLLLDPPQNKTLDTEAILAGAPIDSAAIENQIELIKTASMAERVVARLKLTELDAWSSANPSIVQQIVRAIFSREAVPDPVVDADLTLKTVKRLQGNVAVKRRRLSYIIEVGFTDPNPSLAAQIVNAYADEYLVDQLEAKYDATRRSNEWLNERLGDLRKKVEESERAVALFKEENDIVDTTAGTLTDQQVAKLNEQLILARAETAQALVGLEQLRSVVERGGETSSFADELQSQQLSALSGKASEVRRELAELSSKYGSRHPQVQTARAQLGDIQGQIKNQTQLIVASTENRYRVAKSREESIETSLQEMTGAVSKLSESEIRLRELEREANANRALYESFLSRFKETSQTETRQMAESRILERASTPDVPSAPSKKSIAIKGLMLGLLFGGGLAFLLERLDSGFRTSEQVENQLGVPVLASVPRGDDQIASSVLERLGKSVFPFAGLWPRQRGNSKGARKKRAAMIRLVVEKPLSTYTEAIRALRMGIRFANIDANPRILLLSSALPEEGKSTIASNLAYHAANNGERVLLIDMDLRHPALTLAMSPHAKAGVIEAVLDGANLESLVLKDKQTGLSFLPAPNVTKITHTAEILGSDRVRELLRRALDSFELVVVDTSPLLPVTDGRALMPAVDAFIMVAKWEETNRDAVVSALKQSPGARDKLIGLVLNDVVPSRARYYDFYKSGYYMKKYPHYYGS